VDADVNERKTQYVSRRLSLNQQRAYTHLVSHERAARILIVDDKADLLEALCRILNLEGFSIIGVGSGPLALEALRAAAHDDAKHFDILITDLKMPVMDGLSLLREAQVIDPDLVSIVMTGHGTIDTAVEAMKVGALDYMLKPFKLNVAMPVLRRALAVRRLRLENASLQRELANRAAELEESNRQLQTANKDLDAYNSSVSHDIRGHLNRIIGFSQLLIDGKAGTLNTKQGEFLGHVAGDGEQMLKLTDDLLSFSRLGQRPVLKVRAPVTRLIHDIFRELQGTAVSSTVELRVGELPDAYADPALLKQVFVNLLSNAIKFSSLVPQSVVTVEGYANAGECTYVVRDNGAGFDMVHADQLFKMFHRLHSNAEFAGTGIGLSIVQRIVERHGGCVSVEAAVGMGAQFTFTLPLQTQSRADAPCRPKAMPAAA
jgi:signal transduction histidine kinase